MPNENESLTRIVCADLLAQHSKIHQLSVWFTIGTLLVFMAVALTHSVSSIAFGLAVVILGLGLWETWIAIRVGFDERLLKQVTQIPSLHQIDDSLMQLNLRKSASPNRTEQDRLLGCVGLFRRQVALCFCQFVVVLILLIQLTFWGVG